MAVECEVEGKVDGGITDADKCLPQGDPLEYKGKQVHKVYALEYPKALSLQNEHEVPALLKSTDKLLVHELLHDGKMG